MRYAVLPFEPLFPTVSSRQGHRLIDDAGARVKCARLLWAGAVSEVQTRVKFITHRMESAIARRIRQGPLLFRTKSQGKELARLRGTL